MSAAKHTPGEWIVKPWAVCDKDGAIDSCGTQVVARLPNGDEVGIFSSAVEGEDLADLHLIAAAPDLLEACIEGLEILRLQGLDGGLVGACMRAAIAKATGSAS